MCLILFALNAHPRYRLIVAANRDEFYARPAAAAAFWKDAPQVFAGRDLAAGGTWLGITKTGRFAAVTNYREPRTSKGVKSRGGLTKDFLVGNETPEDYLLEIEKAKNNYSGFNLLVGEIGANETRLFYFSNRGEKPKKLSGGIYGLSNALLNVDWHKVETSKARLTKTLQTSGEINRQELFEILADRRAAPDYKLPQTGIGIERERVLSPAFIETENYGTRLSTVLTVERGERISFTEKTFVGAAGGEVAQEFTLENFPSI
ncbi:MAG: NRDE family protein [Acidobacteria bacterium]|nr:NRDE family protein [Acidobacteriota bacterium]